MELLTKKETHNYFAVYASLNQDKLLMNEQQFNEAVNALLMEPEIVKSLLKRVKKIKAKL